MKVKEFKEILAKLPAEADELEVVHNIDEDENNEVHGVVIDVIGIIGNALLLTTRYLVTDENMNLIKIEPHKSPVTPEQIKEFGKQCNARHLGNE